MLILYARTLLEASSLSEEWASRRIGIRCSWGRKRIQVGEQELEPGRVLCLTLSFETEEGIENFSVQLEKKKKVWGDPKLKGKRESPLDRISGWGRRRAAILVGAKEKPLEFQFVWEEVKLDKVLILCFRYWVSPVPLFIEAVLRISRSFLSGLVAAVALVEDERSLVQSAYLKQMETFFYHPWMKVKDQKIKLQMSPKSYKL